MKVDEIRLVPPMRAAASESFAAGRMAGVLYSCAIARGRPRKFVGALLAADRVNLRDSLADPKWSFALLQNRLSRALNRELKCREPLQMKTSI
jgi:hypothetical protein